MRIVILIVIFLSGCSADVRVESHPSTNTNPIAGQTLSESVHRGLQDAKYIGWHEGFKAGFEMGYTQALSFSYGFAIGSITNTAEDINRRSEVFYEAMTNNPYR